MRRSTATRIASVGASTEREAVAITGATCLKCATARVTLKLGAIEAMPLWQGLNRGTPMGHRDLWMWETIEGRRKSLIEAFKRSEPISATGTSSYVAERSSLSGDAPGDPTPPATDPADQGADFDPVGGYVMFRHADGKTVTFIATTSLPRSRVWHGKARKIPAGKVSAVLEDLLVKCILPEDEAEVGLDGVELFGHRNLRIDAKHRSITSGRTLTLDPETLWRRASNSEWTVAHPHGAKPDVVAERWKEAGVLKVMQGSRQALDGEFVPGFASTVTIEDPALLDRVLALAAEDADAEAILAALLAEAKKAKTSGAPAAPALPPPLEAFIRMLVAA